MASGKVLVSGVRCQPELAYQQFMLTKALAGKNEGRMYYKVISKNDTNIEYKEFEKVTVKGAK